MADLTEMQRRVLLEVEADWQTTREIAHRAPWEIDGQWWFSTTSDPAEKRRHTIQVKESLLELRKLGLVVRRKQTGLAPDMWKLPAGTPSAGGPQ